MSPNESETIEIGGFLKVGRRLTLVLPRSHDAATFEGVDPSEDAYRRVRFEFSVTECAGDHKTVKLTALSAHEGSTWVAALERASAAAATNDEAPAASAGEARKAPPPPEDTHPDVEPLPEMMDSSPSLGSQDDAAPGVPAAAALPRSAASSRSPSVAAELPKAAMATPKAVTQEFDERDREARLIELSADPSVVLKSPEVAYGLLVPRGSGGGGVDRAAFGGLASQRLVPLCDAYVADAVYDALLSGQASGNCRDSPETVAGTGASSRSEVSAVGHGAGKG